MVDQKILALVRLDVIIVPSPDLIRKTASWKTTNINMTALRKSVIIILINCFNQIDFS